MMAERWKLKAR